MANSYRRFERSGRLHLSGQIKKQPDLRGLHDAEDEGINTFRNVCRCLQSTMCNIPEDLYLYKYCTVKISTSLLTNERPRTSENGSSSESLRAAAVSKKIKQSHYRTGRALFLLESESTSGP